MGSQSLPYFPTAKKAGNRHFPNDEITGGIGESYRGWLTSEIRGQGIGRIFYDGVERINARLHVVKGAANDALWNDAEQARWIAAKLLGNDGNPSALGHLAVEDFGRSVDFYNLLRPDI